MASLVFPVQGPISSPYGWREGVNPLLPGGDFHTGIDFSVPVGTPIYATHSGRVDYVNQGSQGGGLVIELYGAQGWRTVYAHLSRYNARIREGEYVHQGQIIGFSGRTGNVTGPHLHYEVNQLRRGSWKPVNPMYATPLSAGANNVGWLKQSGFEFDREGATAAAAAYKRSWRQYQRQLQLARVDEARGVLSDYAQIARSQSPERFAVDTQARIPRLGNQRSQQRPSRFT